MGPILFAAAAAALLIGIRQFKSRPDPAPSIVQVDISTKASASAANPWPRSAPAIDSNQFAGGSATNAPSTNSWLNRLSESFHFTPEQLSAYLDRNGTQC